MKVTHDQMIKCKSPYHLLCMMIKFLLHVMHMLWYCQRMSSNPTSYTLQEIWSLATILLAVTQKLLLKITYKVRLLRVIANKWFLAMTYVSLLKVVTNVNKKRRSHISDVKHVVANNFAGFFLCTVCSGKALVTTDNGCC
jgi:hypothetical protein